MLNVTRAASESKAQASRTACVLSPGYTSAQNGQKKNRWQAHCPPATSVRARLVAQALKPTARGYRGRSPVCTWACHGPTGPRRRGGEGIEGARTYIPTPGCMRERFIIGAPTPALFLQPRKKTQATSRGNFSANFVSL